MSPYWIKAPLLVTDDWHGFGNNMDFDTGSCPSYGTAWIVDRVTSYDIPVAKVKSYLITQEALWSHTMDYYGGTSITHEAEMIWTDVPAPRAEPITVWIGSHRCRKPSNSNFPAQCHNFQIKPYMAIPSPSMFVMKLENAGGCYFGYTSDSCDPLQLAPDKLPRGY